MTMPTAYFLPTDVEGTEALVELALDLHWSWNHSADEVWGQLDPELWQLTHNPWVVIQAVSRTRLKELVADAAFKKQVERLVQEKRRSLERPAWFQQTYPDVPLSCVAYFSMEFMLSEALPIYSGGLGNVAGDQLKAASDMGVPVVGVGLLYQQGYFRQMLDADGRQGALYPYNDPGQLPVTPVREADGEWARLELPLPGYKLWLRAWQAQVGRVKLYLLDGNDPANVPAHRGITSQLYGGGPDLRLTQELVLGIGGWRLLRQLGLNPEVCHLNEGHAAFAVLERARGFMEDGGRSFPESLTVTRGGNLFTTHTPVAAGFDRYPAALVDRYLGGYAANALGITGRELLALGRVNPHDPGEPFNMAYLAIRGSGAVNGVSRLHGEVSRCIFQPRFPRWPETEVPIGHVTNGIHVPSWDSAAADTIWTSACGQDRWRGTMETVGEDIRCVSDAQLWELRADARKGFIHYARQRLLRELTAIGESVDDEAQIRHMFDPNALTIGFARRFAAYKRPNMLLHDPERLVRLLTDPQRPVQLIIAGKAHPADPVGQAMVQAWVRFMQRPEVRDHAVFLSDYDMLLAEQLVQGVDLWINTPRRPWEASGTSGMKVLVNGGLNLSELDGWWAEAYSPEVGWALGDGREHGDDPAWDAIEAESLYNLLEQQVVPAFFNRDKHGIPVAWVRRMRESMARLTPRFSANRSVREYTEKYYIPGARSFKKRSAERGEAGLKLQSWSQWLASHWPTVHFGQAGIKSAADHHQFEIQVYLGEIGPEAVRVQVYAEGPTGEAPFHQTMTRGEQLAGAAHGYLYTVQVPANRPVTDYTIRIIPHHPDAVIPLEARQILWQR